MLSGRSKKSFNCWAFERFS